ncbi:(2Fe-2S)-binding protein [bacterium]|nr:(2Fe-2S)-binding protein [bacterium]
MRIEQHPILDYKKGKKIFFYYNDQKLYGYEGDTIAAALHDNGINVYRITSKGRKRGFFCAIGKCSSCLMVVDDIPNIKTCITPLKSGMKIETQKGKGVYR